MAKRLLPVNSGSRFNLSSRLIPLSPKGDVPSWTIARSSRDHLHPQDRLALGGLASGDGLWLRHDLLEPLGLAGRGVWDHIHQILLNHLRSADRIDFERFIVDTSHVRAVGGGEETVPAPSIARNWAANTRFSPTVKACPWSSIPSRRTLRTPIRPCRCGCRSSDRRQARPPPETPGPCDGGPGLR